MTYFLHSTWVGPSSSCKSQIIPAARMDKPSCMDIECLLYWPTTSDGDVSIDGVWRRKSNHSGSFEFLLYLWNWLLDMSTEDMDSFHPLGLVVIINITWLLNCASLCRYGWLVFKHPLWPKISILSELPITSIRTFEPSTWNCEPTFFWGILRKGQKAGNIKKKCKKPNCRCFHFDWYFSCPLGISPPSV